MSSETPQSEELNNIRQSVSPLHESAPVLVPSDSNTRRNIEDLLQNRELLGKYIDQEQLQGPIINLARNFFPRGVPRTMIINRMQYTGLQSTIGEFFEFLNKMNEEEQAIQNLKTSILLILANKHLNKDHKSKG